MEQIKLDEKYILEYIRDILNDCRIKSKEVENARYHHNTSYEKATTVIKQGLLSKNKQNKLLNRTLTKKEQIIFSDDNYVNGLDNISLSVVGLKDIYRDEMIYDPFKSSEIDILISSDIKAGRNSTNYGNEFLAKNKIENKHFKSIDLRILKYITELKNGLYLRDLKELIKKYNYLSEISQCLLDNNLDIPIREMSNENITLDKVKVIKLPKLILKK